jgi:hypothetical protein
LQRECVKISNIWGKKHLLAAKYKTREDYPKGWKDSKESGSAFLKDVLGGHQT